jgi:hypothetical protein
VATNRVFVLSAHVSRRVLAVAFAVVVSASLPSAVAGQDLTELVPGTAILLDQSTGSGSGGNTKTVSSSTNIFAPATFVDYKRFGGEPTVIVDRYPFVAGSVGASRFCPVGQTSCPARDIVYQSAPQGFVFPHYSQFWKSDDLGQSFRKSKQFPIYGAEQIDAGGGGGDSHQAIGKLTHDVYFVDLTLAPGITMNVSEDLGETWRSDPFGEGLSFLDDRQWVEADEEVDSIYVSTINLLDPVTPALIVTRNTTGWPAIAQMGSSPCNPATFTVGSNIADPAAADAVLSPCPDPADPYLWVAGPVVADRDGTATRPASHNVYIPFVRRISEPLGTNLFGITGWQLYVAKSTNHGTTWRRHRVATLPANVDPANIFVQLAIDRGGNLYYTWSQARNASTTSQRGKRTDEEGGDFTAGEQDIYYTFSTNGGTIWAAPIDLTPGANDSAVMPWIAAGDPGQVDLTYYKSNSGANSNLEDAQVWNVYFGQSQNALNTGSDFKHVQVTAQPNHLGDLSTGGLGGESDRDLLDFITVDIDHLGAAHVAYSDDNRRRDSDTQDFMTRQIAGNSVFKNQSITLQSAWPIRDHAVSDRAGDVMDTTSSPKGACPGMDLTRMTIERQDERITASLTLNGAPTFGKAVSCGGAATTGGLWGVEFWAASNPATTGPSNRFYIAYRDNPPDGGPKVEGGTMDHTNVLVTSLEFNSATTGTLGGTCLPSGGPAATGTCTITLTVAASELGISPGNALNNVTGLSTYLFGNLEDPIPLTRVILGNSEQADATAPMHFLGSGTP